jgi:hypothetical protein
MQKLVGQYTMKLTDRDGNEFSCMPYVDCQKRCPKNSREFSIRGKADTEYNQWLCKEKASEIIEKNK